MIDTLQRVSRRLGFAKPLFVVIGVAALALLTAEIFTEISPDQHDALLIPSAIVFLWALIGYVGLNTFPAVPQETEEKPGFIARVKLRFARFFYYGLAIVFVVLTLASIYMTYKLFGIWAG
ncbi:MAG: hypothetical protein WD002_02270 [Pseudomonadales bacterium]